MASENAPTPDLSVAPAVITEYFRASEMHDADGVAATMTPDAVVTDEGADHRGTDAIRAWVSRVSSAYTYTSTLIGVDVADEGRFVVARHLSGDFPGGDVDLRYAFTLEGDRISRLVIGL